MSEVCSQCKCEIIEDTDTCRSCYGSGESDDLMDWHGCLSCGGKGETTTWHCECDPMGEL